MGWGEQWLAVNEMRLEMRYRYIRPYYQEKQLTLGVGLVVDGGFVGLCVG